MSPRAWVIAAQGAAVVLLVAVVYVTLLREDSGTPLPDIQAPGSEQPAQSPGDGAGAGDGGNARRNQDGERDRGGAPGFAGGGESPVFRGPTPPADQYVDAVSGLLSKVRSAPGASPAADR